MAKISRKQQVKNHGYFAYPCSRGGDYSLHRFNAVGTASFVAVFKTRREAFDYAMTLPAFVPEKKLEAVAILPETI